MFEARRLHEVSERALRIGALRPISTQCETFQERGIPFQLRVALNLQRKDHDAEERRTAGLPPDPFLPPDEDLLVGEVSETHLAVLNKYNVLDDHLLIVTRAFEHQEELLGRADFHALWRCLRRIDGLAFYNGGEVAGASQPHKHLQLAPYPLGPAHPCAPIEAVLGSALFSGDIGRLPAFDFRHALTRIDPRDDPEEMVASALTAAYGRLLAATGMGGAPESPRSRQSGPYNLLMTREWMLLVPRSREHFGTISVNALGYAGALLVRDEAERSRLLEAGALTCLREAASPPPPDH